MAQDYPDMDWYPSAKLRLTVRLDEYANQNKLKPVPKASTKNLTGVKTARDGLSAIADPTFPGRFLVIGKGKTPPRNHEAIQTSADGLTFEMVVIPKSVSWNQTGIRQPDTLGAVIKYIDCPFDPRLIRSCAVEFFLGTVTAGEYGAGVGGRTRPRNPDGKIQDPVNLIPDVSQRNGKTYSNKRFEGFVDKWKVDFTENGEPIINLDCTDNTTLLKNEEMPAKIVVAMKDPIDKAVADFLSNFPQFEGLSVQYLPAGDTPPKLGDTLQHTAFVPQLGPQASKGGGAAKKLSVWDYLTDVCGSIGHIIRIDGDVIIIQTARSFTTGKIIRRPDDPFLGTNKATGDPIAYRQFIYGRNLCELSVSRHYSMAHPKNIEARCYDSSGKTVIVARFPEVADRQKYAIPGDAQPDQKWTVIRVSGLNSKEQVKLVAQTYYESVGRNEINIDMKTNNLASFGGDNLDPDILDMKTGDTFDLLVNRDAAEGSTLTRMEKILTSQEKNAEFTSSLGISPEMAKAYAKAYTDANFLKSFRMKTMTTSWDTDKGVTFTINGINYIEARADVENPSAIPGGTPAPKTAGGGGPPPRAGGEPLQGG